MALPITNVPAGYVDATGIHVPTFDQIYAGLVADRKAIYGADIVLDNSTQDGQMLGLEAAALNDAYALAVAVWNQFSPASAQGTGLSSIVKLNGILRKIASASTVDIVNIGQGGANVRGPQLRDPAGNVWTLPDFTIPASGQVVVTATCATLGAITAPVGTQWTIATPQLGWQSVSNISDAAVGAPVERDPQLRVRQARSVALPSQTVLEGIVADIASLPGVVSVVPYENDTDATDANGIPAHGTAFVVDGGDAAAIASVIARKKTQGAPTYGTSTQTVLQGRAQIPRAIRFFRPTRPQVTYQIRIEPLAGYTADARAALQKAVSDWTNAQGIGGTISIKDVYEPALGVRVGGARPFKVLSILAARNAAVPQEADVVMAFNEAPLCVPDNVLVAPQ